VQALLLLVAVVVATLTALLVALGTALAELLAEVEDGTSAFRNALYAGFLLKLSSQRRPEPSPLKVPGIQEYLSDTPCDVDISILLKPESYKDTENY
jgi:hypothetical protein